MLAICINVKQLKRIQNCCNKTRKLTRMKELSCFHSMLNANNLPDLKVLTIIIHYCLWNSLIHLASPSKPYGKEPHQVSGEDSISSIPHIISIFLVELPQPFQNIILFYVFPFSRGMCEHGNNDPWNIQLSFRLE